MWRTVLAFFLLAVGAYVLINLLVTTEPERVEAQVERLVELARTGGDDAVDEILLAFADDYRGEDYFSLPRIEGYLRQYVGHRRIRSLETGGYTALWKDDEILVPILALYAKTDSVELRPVLRVTFASRDGEWKIVNVANMRLER